MLAHDLMRARLSLPALREELRAIGVFVLDKVVIENLPVQILVIAHLPSPHALRAHGMAALDPVHHVNVVDVLIHDEVARDPSEVIPVAQLVVQLVLARLARLAGACIAKPVARHRGDVPDRTLVDALHGLDVRGLMMPLQTDSDFQIFLLRLLRRFEHAAHARRIHRERLLDEDMLSLPHRLREMIRMKSLRRSDEHEVRKRDGLPVGVEADELIRSRDIHLFGMFFLQHAETLFELVLRNVRHRDQPQPFVRREILARSAGAAPAAADHRDFDRVGIFCSKGVRRCSDGCRGGGGDELASCGHGGDGALLKV